MVNLNDLLSRGDVVEVFQGQLTITPKSGKPVPSYWLQTNQHRLLEQISRIVQQPIYQFVQFRVGRYSSKYDGLTMSFTDLELHQDYFTIFNVSLNRKKKSGRLPGKLFNPPARGALLKFWNSSKLPKPRRPSELYKKINTMKSNLWQAEISKGNKLDSQTLCLANIAYQQIVEAVNSGTSVAHKGQKSGASVLSISGFQKGQNNGAINSGNESAYTHIGQALEDSQTAGVDYCGHTKLRLSGTTGAHSYDISKQGSAVKGNSIAPSIEQEGGRYSKRKPQDQTTAEWLDDYNNA